ncbi:hypothetical protein Tco_1573921 [Tanacetum coccineum]
MDQREPHPAYDFFAPRPLPGYAGNPDNMNRWIEAYVPLLGELGAEVEELMVDPVIDELAEPIAALMVVEAEDDDDSKGFEDDEEVWEVNEEWLMAPITPPPMSDIPPPSTYEVGGPSSAAAEGQSFTLPWSSHQRGREEF